MILQINKYHRTAQGETTSSVKMENDNVVLLHRQAGKQFSDFCSAYYADTSVIDFTVAIIDPKTLKVYKHDEYVSPTVEEQTEVAE